MVRHGKLDGKMILCRAIDCVDGVDCDVNGGLSVTFGPKPSFMRRKRGRGGRERKKRKRKDKKREKKDQEGISPGVSSC